MNRLPIIIPPAVREQIRETVLYIARDSADNALAWEGRLRAELGMLADIHGHAVDESASERLGRTLRKVVFERTYLIHYHVSDAGVYVVNLRHGARLPRAGEP